MNLTKLKRLTTGGALAFALAVGLIVIASTPAQAQHRNDGYYGDQGRGGYGGGNDVYRKAYDNGYNSGVSHGRDHSRQRHRYDPTDPSEYRSGTSGYSGHGSKDAYKQSFREGFRAGYDVGYRQNGGGYGNDPSYRTDPRNDPYYRNDPSYGGQRGGRPRGNNGNHGHRRGSWWPF